MKHKSLIILALTIIFMILLSGCMRKMISQTSALPTTEEETNEEGYRDLKGVETFKVQDMEFVVNYGIDGYVKYGQYFSVQARIVNHGEDHDGVFQVIIPGEGNDNALYEQNVKVKANETTDVEFVIRMNGIGDQFQYRFVDEDNETIVEKVAAIKLLEDQKDIFIGVLSNGQSEFRYLEDGDTELIYLKKDNIMNDYHALEALDGIIIYNYDLELLTKDQYISIEKWVREGGSLILEKNSKNYFLDLLKERTGTKKNFFTKYNVEFGNVLVADEDLNIQTDQFQTIGMEIQEEIIHDLGEGKLRNNSNRYGGTFYNYRINDILSIPESKEVPEVTGYIIVLSIYILLIGPVLYIVLKKRDKRHLVWMLVPMTAIIFTFVVYALGFHTRITEPYAKYLTYTKIGEDGKAVEDTYFSLTSPYNIKYNAIFHSKYPVGIISNEYGYMYGNLKKHDYTEYTKAVEYKEDSTNIFMQKFSSFSPLYFIGSRETTKQGGYQYSIKDNINEISGEFTNNLGYDLSHTAIMCNGTIIPVGDIKDGETTQIKSDSGNSYSTLNSIYYTDVIEKIAGGSLKSKNLGVLKRYKALEIYLEDSMVNLTKDNYLIGFSSEKDTQSIMNTLSIKGKGIEVVVIPLEIGEINDDGDMNISNLDCYITDTDGYSIDIYRYMPNDVVDVKYTFGKSDKIKSIQYSNRGNLEFNPNSKAGFIGSIYFYNNRIKNYELVFESGKARSITDIAPYLDDENNLLVKYKAETEKLREVPVTLPVLTATKEAY